jgi:hypothetical protein
MSNLVLLGAGSAAILAFVLNLAKNHGELVNALWKATTFSVLVTGATLAGLFAVGVAVHYSVISIPIQYCHYLGKDQPFSDRCK